MLDSSANSLRNLAIANCDHIVYLACDPKAPATYAACSAYMTAALNTGHTMMFTYGENTEDGIRKGKWNVMAIDAAKPKLRSNANTFIKEYGRAWFFCKCKSERVKQCEEMELK